MNKYKFALPKSYEYIKVGATYSSTDRLTINDDTGDNISDLNPFFCELTAYYWVWKNAKDDIVGIMHYRRYLSHTNFFNFKKLFLNEKEIKKHLKKYDLITSSKYNTKVSVKDNLLSSVREKDYEKLRMIIQTKYPDYLDSFDLVMKSNFTYLCNIIVAKKEVFDKYCAWLFDVLFSLRKYEDFNGYTKSEMRLYGYLSERLLTVYVIKNKLSAKEYPLVNVENSFIRKIRDKIKC